MISNTKSELVTFMDKSTQNLKYHKHIFLRLYEHCEVVNLSTEKKRIDKRVEVQRFLKRMHIT